MSKRSKQKGDRLERLVVAMFTKAGCEAKRVPLSGAARGFKGDVHITIQEKSFILECKSRKQGFMQLYQWLEQADALVVKADRQPPLLVLPLEAGLEWLERLNLLPGHRRISQKQSK